MRRTTKPGEGKSNRRGVLSFSFKRKVGLDARRRIQESKDSGEWWNKDIPFNHAYLLSASNRDLIEKLFDELYEGQRIYERDKKIKTLEVLIANLIKQTKRPIRTPLDEKKWRKNPLDKRYKRVGISLPKLVHKLNERGYIEMKLGNEAINRQTRITATEKLLSLCEQLPKSVIYDPVELVELKTFQGKYKNKPTPQHPRRIPVPVNELDSYKDTDNTRRIRKILETANRVNTNANILHGNKKIGVSLTAIFIENFSMYGRLHTRGFYHLQELTQKERNELTINGCPVIELDFSALHPNLLYAANGIQYPLTKDAYSQAVDHKFARPFLKIILLTMLNSESFKQAEAAANHWLRTEKIKNEDGHVIDTHRLRLKRIGIRRAGPLIQKMEEAHKPISNYFFNGKKTGLKVMNKDASIAVDVVAHFTRKGIPILPVHDSFIIQKQYGPELKEIMKQTYKKHTKGFEIRVK